MADEETIFDPSLKKKKKKKKTTFDIDAALAEGTAGEGNDGSDQQFTDKENQEPTKMDDSRDLDLDDGNLDLENFGKKKKKKKKFNMDELEGALPEPTAKSKEDFSMEVDGPQEDGQAEGAFDLDMDFSTKTKKKKKKKKDFEELVAEDEKDAMEDTENVEGSQTGVVRRGQGLHLR